MATWSRSRSMAKTGSGKSTARSAAAASLRSPPDRKWSAACSRIRHQRTLSRRRLAPGGAYAASRDRAEAACRRSAESGAGVSWHDARETADLIGSVFYRGCLHDPRALAINALTYARGLARAAREVGVGQFCDSPATRIDRAGAGAWRVSTPKGEVVHRSSSAPMRTATGCGQASRAPSCRYAGTRPSPVRSRTAPLTMCCRRGTS